MSIDPAVVGRKYHSQRPYDVGREKVREFAESIGDPREDYVAVDAPAPLAPPTFAFVLTLDGWHAIMADLEHRVLPRAARRPALRLEATDPGR